MFTVLSNSIHLATGVRPADSIRTNARHHVVLDNSNTARKHRTSAISRFVELLGAKH